ncbi:MAG: UDP-N-acetylmuramoyl-L-alanine--D-glutamate ligase [Clostridium sp.]|nr:UDP-N-acetylmuramoyl-L-alanine--D-glutamate ligase [Clostridium sp.]
MGGSDFVEEQKWLVVGSGISGLGAVALLERLGAQVILFDENTKTTKRELEQKLPKSSKAICVQGTLPKEYLSSIRKAVLSPGVPMDIPLIDQLKDAGIEILGEIELASIEEKGKVIAITGTNGKTTTTSLVAEIMRAHCGRRKVLLVGNIGRSYTAEVRKSGPDTVTVAEISSFQLETAKRFRPNISAILNITPDHLNRHHTMEAYVKTKEKIAANQDAADICVLNYDNAYTRDFAKRCTATPVFFSGTKELSQGYFLQKEHIMRAQDGQVTPLLHIQKDLRLVGLCNVENVMAAIAITQAMGVPWPVIRRAIRAFHAVEHRIEYVDTVWDVDYYNDSKATNPDSAIWGIKAMSKPTILIAGGYDKNSDYNDWIGSFESRVKALLLIGQTKERIAACAKEKGVSDIRMYDTYEDCLEAAYDLAKPGDAVLLSPACASWGMFRNFEERGALFKEFVKQKKEIS